MDILQFLTSKNTEIIPLIERLFFLVKIKNIFLTDIKSTFKKT